MKAIDILKTANGNLLRSKTRTFLTILAIFIGSFTMALTTAMGTGITAYMEDQVGNLGQDDVIFVSPKVEQASSPDEPLKFDEEKTTVSAGPVGPGTAVLTGEDVKRLQAFDGLDAVEPMVTLNLDYIANAKGEKFQVAFTPLPADTKFDLVAGEQLEADGKASQVVLPGGYVRALGYADEASAVGQEVTLAISDPSGKRSEFTATIAGVMNKGIVGATGVVANTELIEAMHAVQVKGLPAQAAEIYMAVSAKIPGELTDANINALKADLEEMGYSGTTLADSLGVIDTIIKTITTVLSGFSLIALLAAGFGIVNTLLMSVQERTKEIGLMKAMGMSPARIFGLFSVEAVLIGFWGSVIGVGGAYGLGQILNAALSEGPLESLPGLTIFGFDPATVVGVMALIMALAFVAGALPARRAAKMDPIEALRYE